MRSATLSILLLALAAGAASSQTTRPDGAVQVTVPPGAASDQNPAFDPASGTLVFTRFDQGYNDGPAALHVVDLATLVNVRVTPVEDQDNVNLPGTSWSPLLDRIVLASDRASAGSSDDLWRVAPDGSDFSRITTHLAPPSYLEPTWSSASDWIVFEASSPGASPDGRVGKIWKVKADGSLVTPLTTDPAMDDRQPNWSPAGDVLLFQRRTLPAGEFDLYTMAADGSGLANVTATPSWEDTDASWSPGGSMIVYSSNDGGLATANIFAIAASGGTPVRVTNSFVEDGAPSWSPDGRTIAFESHADDTLPSALWRIDAPSSQVDFSATPRIGPAPLAVQFADLSAGASTWLWDFGDGATAAVQSPSHTYLAAGRHTVSLTVGTTTLTRPDYILATQATAANIVTGPGPDPSAVPRVLAYDVLGQPNTATNIIAYGAGGYGANVGAGDVDGAAPAEILTGPGPGSVYGPQVRAFQPSSQPVAKINFYAYGTLRFGAGVQGVDIDIDGFAEILTAAGPGAVFGPHVRGFDYDAGVIAPIGGINFFAYGTLKYGINVGAGNVAGATTPEILTMPGPGAIFGPQVHGYLFRPPVQAISNMNFFAFASAFFGGRVDGGDLEGDGWDELLAGLGAGPTAASSVRGFDYDDVAVTAIAGVDFMAFATTLHGAEPHGGELDGDGMSELLVATGPDPASSARAQGFDYTTTTTPIAVLDLTPYGSTYGLHVQIGSLGF